MRDWVTFFCVVWLVGDEVSCRVTGGVRCWAEIVRDVLAALKLACDPEVFPLETGSVQAVGNAFPD